jgi:hypothetical protein
MSSTAYWYQLEPHHPFDVPPVEQRRPVLKGENGEWVLDLSAQTSPNDLLLNEEMKQMKQQCVENIIFLHFAFNDLTPN